MSTVNSEIHTVISAGIEPPPCRQSIYNLNYNRYEMILLLEQEKK
jgi:hypothetical protein